MIEDTIRKIEDSLRGGAMDAARKAELLALLADLKSELAALEPTRGADARRIAILTQTAHAAAIGGGDETRRRRASERLADSVRDFESSHPKLTSVVEAIAESLASAGL